MIGIHYELFDIYTLQIKEVDINKKSNVSLIFGSVKLKSSGVWIENPKKIENL